MTVPFFYAAPNQHAYPAVPYVARVGDDLGDLDADRREDGLEIAAKAGPDLADFSDRWVSPNSTNISW